MSKHGKLNYTEVNGRKGLTFFLLILKSLFILTTNVKK